MNAVKEDVEKLVQKELESANQRFPMFRSDHEGAAVILEEIEEALSEMLDIELHYKGLWENVKENFINTARYAELISDDAICLACEAIQVAAMAQKFIDSQKERENDACVISQNNQIDVPYEMTAFHVSDNIIRMNMIGDTGKGSIMAVYSTSEKAEKSMLLLRKIYVKAPLENDAKEMREFVRGTFKAIGTSGYVEPESNYFVFRFPQEDEI